MKMTKVLVFFCAAMLMLACDKGDTGNFKISLKLPENIVGNCATDWKYDDFIDDFCIVKGDTIELTIFSTDDLAEGYVVDETKVFPVTGQISGETEFSRSLRTDRYYKFFVKVTNEREKVKLTGGLEGLFYEETKNYDVNVFLGLTGDFVRLVSDQGEKSSLETYIPEDDGSSGSRATVLRDGRILLAGGAVYNNNGDEVFEKTTNIVDTAHMKVEKGPLLKDGVKDHAMATLHASNAPAGKAVVAFGKTRDGYNANVYLIDPAKKTVESKGSFGGRAHARALTINGEVYITGGCDATSATKDIIKVDKTGAASKWRDMTQGRCLHGMVDVSYTDGEGNFRPAILVFGGATKYIIKNIDRSLIGWDAGDTFAEVITENGSTKITVENAGLGFTLAGHASVRMKWDDQNKGPADEIVAMAAGGFLQPAVDQDITLSPNNYIIRGTGDLTNPTGLTWTLSSYGSSIKCAYAMAAPISSPENFSVQYAALNCGSGKSVERDYDNRDEQQIYVLEVRASGSAGSFSLTASARAGLVGTTDPNNPGLFSDGPVAANDFGQAFLFGTRYVYVVSGFSYGLY